MHKAADFVGLPHAFVGGLRRLPGDVGVEYARARARDLCEHTCVQIDDSSADKWATVIDYTRCCLAVRRVCHSDDCALRDCPVSATAALEAVIRGAAGL